MSSRRPGTDRRRRRTLSDHSSGDGPLHLYGVHAVAAALANPERRVRALAMTRNAGRRLAEMGVRLPPEAKEAEPAALDRLVGRDAVHQGVVATVDPLPPAALEDVLQTQLLVALDQVTDPHNVGAVLRSCAAFGAAGLILTTRRAPGEAGALAKAAAGALETVPLVRVTNLARALSQIRDAGGFLIGLDSSNDMPLEEAVETPARPLVLVLGAEGHGLRRLSRERCDALARIRTSASLASLNVSNAAAIALYELARGARV